MDDKKYVEITHEGIDFKILEIDMVDLSANIEAEPGTVGIYYIIEGLEYPVYLLFHNTEDYYQFVYKVCDVGEEVMMVSIDDKEVVALLTDVVNNSGVFDDEDD